MPFRAAFLLGLAATSLWARHLPIQVFTSAQGLPRNSVECLVPGPTGFLWICTSEGLVRFDGYRFRVFGTSDGLPSRTVVDFVPARKGGFWVVTDLGVCRLPPGAKIGEPCRLLPVDHPSGDFTTNCLLESDTGETWVATTDALFRLSFDGRRLERTTLQLRPHEMVETLADGQDGAVLVATDFGLFEWQPRSQDPNPGEAILAVRARLLLRISPSEVWVYDYKDLYRIVFQGARRATYKQPVEGHAEGANCILRRRDGSVWTAGWTGIGRLEVGTDGRVSEVDRYTQADGLPVPTINIMAEDSQGNLWGAAEGSGIFRIVDSGFVSYYGSDGLGAARIASIFEDRSARLLVQESWASQPNVLVKQGSHFQSIPLQHPAWHRYFGWGWNQYVVPAREGDWWVAAGQALLHFPKVKRAEDLARTPPVSYGADSPLGCSEVFRAAEDSRGDIWITCLVPKRRLTRWERSTGQFHHWTAAEGWPQEAVGTVFRDGSPGVLWIGTADAAVRFQDGHFQFFPLTAGGSRPGVRDLLIDHDGRVWIATWRAGVFRCDNPKDPSPAFRLYTTREGLSSDTTSSLAEDRAGFIYVGTARGVDRIDPHAPLESRRIRHFTAADGLPESEQNTAFRDSQGHLWFGSLNGLAEFDPSKAGPQPPPEVYVTRVRVRGDDLALPWEGTRSLSLDLASDRNQVEIEYAGLDLRAPASVRYQYRLNGLDSAWSEPVEQPSVNYATLPRGALRFEVRAVDSEGQLSRQPAGIQLFVRSPLWLRWWFLLAVAALIAATAAGSYRYRVSQLLAMERLRTRIATDLHDDMGASLSQISILSELARKVSTPQVLADIAEIARGMVGDMSDIVWAINPRHDRFDGLVHRMRRFAEDTLGGKNIELDFRTTLLADDSAVPLEIRRPLYLVFKEAVNNVARHSGGTKASIHLVQDRSSLTLTVEDNGRGFDSKKLYEGEGVASIARRMRDIGGAADWDSEPGAGTRLTAILPLAAHGALHELGGRIRGNRR